MAIRHWMCHWKNRFWRPDVNRERELIAHSAGNSFVNRGIESGDVVYIVTLIEGQLYLGGRMTVERIASQSEAIRIFGRDIYEADEHLIGLEGSGTPLHLRRRLSPDVAKQLRFRSKGGEKGLFFVSETKLDKQTTREVRELVPESAALLDRILELTDHDAAFGDVITITSDFLWQRETRGLGNSVRMPGELPSGMTYIEGNSYRVEVNRFERDPKARAACIAHYGSTCTICGFDFGTVYGPRAEGFIHVHHLHALSDVGEAYDVDPIEDLRPVCPNCHAVLHLRAPAFSMDEVRAFLAMQSGP